MKYTAAEVNKMSYYEWMSTIASELNLAGFKADRRTLRPYTVSEDGLWYFFMGAINDPDAMNYLKRIGLVNNGRCPMCGREIKGTPSQFTDNLHPGLDFYICTSCRKEGQRRNGQGCLLGVICLPWFLLKNIFT